MHEIVKEHNFRNTPSHSPLPNPSLCPLYSSFTLTFPFHSTVHLRSTHSCSAVAFAFGRTRACARIHTCAGVFVLCQTHPRDPSQAIKVLDLRGRENETTKKGTQTQYLPPERPAAAVCCPESELALKGSGREGIPSGETRGKGCWKRRPLS